MYNFFARCAKLLLVIFILSTVFGLLYAIHRDVGIGAAIISIYGGLYWLYRKTIPFNQKERYPIARYRGQSVRKKKFFS